ncbi:MAG: glycoside hydrolase family 5 protein [Treponema sp.]|nr:glycoside hydrolase family 5 protein [Treponema sp.]
MKKAAALLFGLILLLAFALCAFAMTEKSKRSLSHSDFLTAKGKFLAKQNGEKVTLRGVNAGGYLLKEFWMTPCEYTRKVKAEAELFDCLCERFGKEKALYLQENWQKSFWTEKDFDNCSQMGMNCVRLPFWHGNLIDSNGNFMAAAFDRLDWFLTEAGKRGLYVILDFHGAPGSQNGSDHSGVDGRNNKIKASEFFFGENSAKNQELFYTIWEEIARRCKDNPVVAAYDLLNEPFCTYRYNSGFADEELRKILWEIYDRAYKRIRAVDSRHLIAMEAVWDPVDLPNPKDYGWENVVYEYHNYFYGDDNNQKGGQISSMKRKLKAIEKAGYELPSFMGEFNFFANLKAWDEGLSLLNKSGISWTMWTYKTVRQVGNWGLYYSDSSIPSINIEKDSFEKIEKAFCNMQSADCNLPLRELLEKHLSAPNN